MKDEKMWEEKVVIHLHFLWPGLYRRMIQEVKMALVFAFPKLLSVICYLYRKKIIFGNCQLSTVTLVTQKKSFLETVILLYCNAWG